MIFSQYLKNSNRWVVVMERSPIKHICSPLLKILCIKRLLLHLTSLSCHNKLYIIFTMIVNCATPLYHMTFWPLRESGITYNWSYYLEIISVLCFWFVIANWTNVSLTEQKILVNKQVFCRIDKWNQWCTQRVRGRGGVKPHPSLSGRKCRKTKSIFWRGRNFLLFAFIFWIFLTNHTPFMGVCLRHWMKL